MNSSITRRHALATIAGFAAVGLSAGCRLAPRSAGPPARAKAPSFMLRSHHGVDVSLAQLHADNPAVVVFYRGFW